MRRHLAVAVVVLLTLGTTPGRAVITKPISLASLSKDSTHQCVARVESLDPARPAMIVTVETDLKGKLTPRRWPVNLKGDRDAAKLGHTPLLLKRLTKGLPLVVFLLESEEQYTAFCFTNGTWFQLLGVKDGEAVRWSFQHCEPYFRRTFKGTTDELREIIEKKKEPPAYDEKAEPGLGPEAKQSRGPGRGSLFAVIVGLPGAGIIAALALLFPAIFGGLAILMRRWAALMSVVFTNSTIFSVYILYQKKFDGYWWGSPSALWVTIGSLTVLGLLWAWARHLKAVAPDSTEQPVPPRTERWTMTIVSVLCALGTGSFFVFDWNPSRYNVTFVFVLIMSLGFWAGTAYLLLVQAVRKRRPSERLLVPTEGMVLGAMVLACLGLTIRESGEKVKGARTLTSAGGTTGAGPKLKRQVWNFTAPNQTNVASSPLVVGERVYIAVNQGNSFGMTGRIYCLDRASGVPVWQQPFGDRKTTGGEPMRQVLSTPSFADGRLYIGEGYHENGDCRLFCLDAETGAKVWQFPRDDEESDAESSLWDVPTNSHVESSPCVAGGRVYFGYGDKGLYCVEAATGKKCWQYPAPVKGDDGRLLVDRDRGLHVDASPVVFGNRVYCCSGRSRTFALQSVFCVDARSGENVWVHNTELPAWGSPVVADGRVIVGLGNTRIGESRPDQQGAVTCLDAFDGSRIWHEDLKGAVHARAVCDGKRFYIGSQDGYLYAFDCRGGRIVWKRDLRTGAEKLSEVIATAALARGARSDQPEALYVAATRGDVFCLDPESGDVYWHHDELSGGEEGQGYSANLISSLTVQVRRTREGDERRIFFASSVNGGTNAVVFCLEDEWTEEAK